MLRFRQFFLFVALSCGAVVATEAKEFTAADWPMWLISSVEAIRSPPPPAKTDEELRQLKDLICRRTDSDAELVMWWDRGGPVYRWNQIAVDELLEHGNITQMATRHLAPCMRPCRMPLLSPGTASLPIAGRGRVTRSDAHDDFPGAGKPVLSLRLCRGDSLGSGRCWPISFLTARMRFGPGLRKQCIRAKWPASSFPAISPPAATSAPQPLRQQSPGRRAMVRTRNGRGPCRSGSGEMAGKGPGQSSYCHLEDLGAGKA